MNTRPTGSAPEICGRPLWLANALENIQASAAPRISTMSRRRTIPATAHMFIINPLHSRLGRWLICSRTHPSTENRIAALQKLAGQSGEGLAPRPASNSRGPWNSGPRRGPWG